MWEVVVFTSEQTLAKGEFWWKRLTIMIQHSKDCAVGYVLRCTTSELAAGFEPSMDTAVEALALIILFRCSSRTSQPDLCYHLSFCEAFTQR